MSNFSFKIPIKITESVQTGQDTTLTIEGVAITETVTRNGVKYTAEELSTSAHTLTGKPILKDHENKIDNIVGRVVGSSFVNKGIQFTGKIMDEKVKEMIKDGRITNVSIGAKVSELVDEEKDGQNYKVAKGLEFLELSLTPVPGDPNAGITLMHALAESYDVQSDKIIKEEKKMDTETKVDVSETLKAEIEAKEKMIAELLREKKEAFVNSILEVNKDLKKEDLMAKEDSELKLIKEYETKLKESKKVEDTKKSEIKSEVFKQESVETTKNYVTERADDGVFVYVMPNSKGMMEGK